MHARQQIDRLFENEVPIHKSEAKRHRAFNVYLNGKNIDTVFYSSGTSVDADEVKRSLINHDGYDSEITVREVRK
jgi:hypothetical protein